MEKWTSLPSETAEHLEPEVLAAFLDGELSEDENRQVRGHLAECEECYELFADTASFLRQEEPTEGTVRPFEDPRISAKPPAIVRHRPWRQNVAMAATVVLAVGVGALGYQGVQHPQVSLELLTPKDIHVKVVRGGGEPARPGRKLSQGDLLLLGATTVDLRVRLDAGQDVRRELEDLLDNSTILRNLHPGSVDSQAAKHLLSSNDLRDALLDPQWFDLGQLAEAGAVAAGGGKSEFFRGWSGFQYRRALSRLLRKTDGALPPKVLDDLRQVEALLKAPTLNLTELEKIYKQILNFSRIPPSPSGT